MTIGTLVILIYLITILWYLNYYVVCHGGEHIVMSIYILFIPFAPLFLMVYLIKDYIWWYKIRKKEQKRLK